MKRYFFLLFQLCLLCNAEAQIMLEKIESDFTLSAEREKLRKDIYSRTIGETFSLPLNGSTEYRYQSAFWSISQFLVDDSIVRLGFSKTFAAYPSLADETRRSFLEALYALNPQSFLPEVKRLLPKESHPKIFAMAALFVYRIDPSARRSILETISKKWPAPVSNTIILALTGHLNDHEKFRSSDPPPVEDLFAFARSQGYRAVYSFQRWNRDHPGIAIVQGSDGKFARDAAGRIITIEQLARSGSNLPYFITNGNTPQGIYRISGTAVSSNRFIGPTPNLQLSMPFEGYWSDYFHLPADSTAPLQSYLYLLPESWQSYLPMREAFIAGKAGRTEIIAHGTTIDPVYFSNMPFYPISPTLGCLCAREIWDPQTGKLKDSEQFRLAETFLKTPGEKGYLFVINLDDKEKPLKAEEISALAENFEKGMHNKGQE